MRLAFLGTAGFAVPALRALLESDHEVAAVVTGPDKPAGRGRQLTPTPVKAYAQQQGFTGQILTPPSPRDPEFSQQFKELDLDAAVVVAYRILPPEVFDSPKLGTLNIHPSLLPKYRGPAPLNWALINGDRVTGVSIIRISEKVDAGGVVLQEEFTIESKDNVATLGERLAPEGGRMALEALEKLAAGELEPIEQDESQVIKAPKLSKEDGRIDWSMPAEQIQNRIRGLTPWPGAFTTLPDSKVLKLFETVVRPASGDERNPGDVFAIEENSFRVFCGAGTSLTVLEVQLQGKKRMPVSEFLRGFSFAPGTTLGDS